MEGKRNKKLTEKKQLNKLLGKILNVRQLAPSLKQMTEEDLKRRRKLYTTSKEIDQERYEEMVAEGFDDNDREIQGPKNEIDKFNLLLQELDIIEEVMNEMPLYELDRKITVYEKRKEILQKRLEEVVAEGFEQGDKERDEVEKEIDEVEGLIDTCEKLKNILPENFRSGKEIDSSTVTPTTDSKNETNTQSKTQTNAQSKNETNTQSKTQTNAQPKNETNTQSKTQTNAQPKNETNTQPETQTNAQPKNETNTQSKNETNTQSKNEINTQPKNEIRLPECNIIIGRTGTIEYKGKEYEVSSKNIKEAVKINSFNDQDLSEYLKTECNIKSKDIEYVKDLVKEGYLDMTVIHAIYSTDMPIKEKQELFNRQVNKIQYSKAGKKFDGLNITYNMKDLSEVNIFKRLFRREVNLDEKSKIYENAINAERWELGKIKGKYEPLTKKEKFLHVFRNKKISLPVQPEYGDIYTVATEYNKIAFDEEGNKLNNKDVKDAFKSRIIQNRELDENNKERLSDNQEVQLWKLVKEQINTSENDKTQKENEEDNTR